MLRLSIGNRALSKYHVHSILKHAQIPYYGDIQNVSAGDPKYVNLYLMEHSELN